MCCNCKSQKASKAKAWPRALTLFFFIFTANHGHERTQQDTRRTTSNCSDSSVSPIRSRSCETHLICVRACIEMDRWRWRAKGKVSNGAHTATLGAIHIHNNCCDVFTAQNTRCNNEEGDGAFLKEKDRGSRCNTSRPDMILRTL